MKYREEHENRKRKITKMKMLKSSSKANHQKLSWAYHSPQQEKERSPALSEFPYFPSETSPPPAKRNCRNPTSISSTRSSWTRNCSFSELWNVIDNTKKWISLCFPFVFPSLKLRYNTTQYSRFCFPSTHLTKIPFMSFWFQPHLLLNVYKEALT